MINIDKNIPLPDSRQATKAYKYPWHTMEVGDSFLTTITRHSHASSLIQQARKSTGHKYATRKTEAGIRIWRIE